MTRKSRPRRPKAVQTIEKQLGNSKERRPARERRQMQPDEARRGTNRN